MAASDLARVLRLVGLGARSRGVVIGVEQCKIAVLKNKVAFVVVAEDASENTRKKIIPLLNARRIRFIEVPSATELGGVVGRQATACVGIVDRQLAKGVRELVESGPPRAQ